MNISKAIQPTKVSNTLVAGLLASTMMTYAGHALAQAAEASSAAPQVQEVVVTASRRSESIQNIPVSIQALDNRKLEQLNVTQFQDYVKYTPSVSFQTQTPSQTSIYMRGVASGDNANHSGPLPSVGVYLDEQPITTIGGTIDVHPYDMARIEVLPGPQGTLYGASSEAGTLRLITNKPTSAAFSAGYDIQGNTFDHGGPGYVAEGFVNVPITDKMAVRIVGWDEHDGGYIDNVAGSRTFATSGSTFTNAGLVKDNFNKVDTYGGRAALKIDLNNNWTITPSFIAQDQRIDGVFGYEPAVGDLKVQRFQPDTDHDRFFQAALTVNGKIGNLDLVYSGGYFARSIDSRTDYTDYSVFYDAINGSGAFWTDNNGNVLPNPAQEIVGRDRFTKRSNELRIVSPASDRLHFIAGVFEERQTHWIVQDYQIAGFGDAAAANPANNFSVPGYPGTIWLTDQERIDRDVAAYVDATFDITPKLSLTAGVRGYAYNNSLQGFFGFSSNYSSGTGQAACFNDSHYHNEPCQDLDKTVAASGETHKINLTYRFDPQHLAYFTYSTGYRPGGVNRNGNFGPYQADTLTNYEVGFKTSWFQRRLTFNAALYDEDWSNFQFSFLGPNSLTIIENAPQANIKGVEFNSDWQATEHLSFSTGGSYNDAKLTKNFCGTDQSTGQLISSCSNVDAEAVKGTQLPYTPKFKGNIIARYTFDLFNWNAHVQASAVYLTQNYVGLRTADTDSLGKMSGYATADFAFGVEKHGLTLEAFIKNAFDSRGEENRYTPCTVSVCASTSVQGVAPAVYVVPIQPMQIGLKMGQKF
ncbi:TonB-dependent receptor [Caulobacter sp. S45]|uniref:TonB-dependent receptor n=1 Tax=Caulobacter sp. S45 TaxID=1641861 RepID=UPI00131CD358|nr:TonB-dependent receptor [Caulobacter sp. S45]